MFLELVVKKCKNLKYIKLTTQPDNRPQTEQKKCFRSIIDDLKKRHISLNVEYSDVLHDREIVYVYDFILIYLIFG